VLEVGGGGETRNPYKILVGKCLAKMNLEHRERDVRIILRWI
jgi:hypothetical protein